MPISLTASAAEGERGTKYEVRARGIHERQMENLSLETKEIMIVLFQFSGCL